MPIFLFTKHNQASKNIAEKLIDGYGFKQINEKEWELDGLRLIDTEAPSVLDIPTDFETDLLVILSSHKSKTGNPSLTTHIPGNWDNADFGGESRTLNIADASTLTMFLQEMKKECKLDWNLSLETDHHGPTCKVPIIFVEIGSTEKEWVNDDAGKIIATAVMNTIRKLETGNRKLTTVAGFGGGHYAREFTKLVLEKNLCIGHICPKYALDNLTENTFKQAIEKNIEKVSEILVLKDATNSKQKEKLKKLATDCGVRYTEI